MRDLVIEARKNDEKKVLILKKFEPLLKRTCSIYVKNKDYFEDAMQEGRIAILKCIEHYNLESNAYFEGYVKRAVINSVRNFANKVNREFLSLDYEVTEDGESFHEIVPSDVDIEGDSVKKETFVELYRAMEKLTDKQREIIVEVYFKGKSMVEVAGNRRCHYMAVARLKERAVERLREEMNECQAPDI